MGQRGFTLVEVLMAGAIVGLVGSAVFVLAQTGNQLWGSTESRLATLTIAQKVMDALTDDLRRARRASLVAPCALPLTFTTVNGRIVTYTLNEETLVRREQEAEQPPIDRVVGSELTALSTSCDGDGIVRLSLTVQSRRFSDASRQTVISQVMVQNP